MLLGVELTPRQAARVLEQALRTRAVLELEPRNLPAQHLLRGYLAGRAAELLRIELAETDPPLALGSVLGAFCDVSTVLSGELYLFSTVIVDGDDDALPRCLLLAAPHTIQVANRRRYERRLPRQAAQVRLSGGALHLPQLGPLVSISPTGLACRLPQTELDEQLLIGDEIQVSFAWPGSAEFFELPAIVCNKALTPDKTQLKLGLEFRRDLHDSPTGRSLERLRALLCDTPVDPPGQTMNGEP